jgi:hypothetical protein
MTYSEVKIYIPLFGEWYGGIALDHGLDDRWFESRQKLRIFLFSILSRPALGPTQAPMK